MRAVAEAQRREPTVKVMNRQATPLRHRTHRTGAQEGRVLVLQGGGALGAYQAGVYERAGRSGDSSPTGSPASRSARSTPR